ncbi:MAG: hypothetical protein EPO09_20635 [Aquabacterium sp.]|uniref:hypothetical protein n=1 Tax=Aquabacterium sp. TaxID=1872578 RepID=UPI00120DEB5F|nr:hypothetical protein [Aquabacterium sp.]TAK84891.1 MAG: hypothetical protein EPO09_20635 [Aquabacterium sp.]
MKKLIRRAAVCIFALSLSVDLMAEGIADSAALFLKADPGNYIGFNLPTEGQTFVNGTGQQAFRTYLWGPDVTVFYSGWPQDFSLTFSAPRYSAVDNLVQTRPLEVGFYDNARRPISGSDLNPGMEVSGFARGYNKLSGWFNVLEVSQDIFGEITSLAVDFAEYGETLNKSGPALYGSFRYNSAIPLTATIPEPGSQVLFLIGCLGLILSVQATRSVRGGQ